MKLLKKLLIAFVLIYVITLGLVYVDVYDSRPIVNLFKNFQTDSSLKLSLIHI